MATDAPVQKTEHPHEHLKRGVERHRELRHAAHQAALDARHKVQLEREAKS